MEVGSLEIVGRINTENINAGLASMRRGLDSAKTSAKSAFGDISRIGGAVAGMLPMLTAMGGGIAGTFGALAMMSPQAAPHIEKMKTEFFRLSTIIGDVLEPVISRVSDSFTRFVDWMGSPEGRGIIEGVAGAIDSLIGSLETFASFMREYEMDVIIGEGLKWLVDSGLIPVITGAAIGGSIGGLPGAVVGAGAGAAVSYGPGFVEETKERHQEAIETGDFGSRVPAIDIINWIKSIIYGSESDAESESWSQMKNAHTGGA